MAKPTHLHNNWGNLSYSYDKTKKIHRASIKYSIAFLDLAMNDVNGYLPPSFKKSVRYYGGVASKNKNTFDDKVQRLIRKFNESAIKMEKNIEKFDYTDIAMLDRENIHSYHYEVNYKTYDSWMDRMNVGEECVLCKKEQENNEDRDRHLRHIMEDNEGIAFLVLNLMPPIGFKTWSREAIEYALREYESD